MNSVIAFEPASCLNVMTRNNRLANAQFWHITMYGLDFGEPQRVETRQGTAYMREAAPTEQFWSVWRQNKDEVKAAGFSLGKYHDEWVVSYWSDSEDCPIPKPLA